MARPAAGLNARHASLLLRCQQLRETRAAAEAAQRAAGHAACRQQAHAAQTAADGHAADAAAALRRGYDDLVGRGSATSAIHALQAREAAARRQQTRLADAVTAAQDQAAQAAALEAAARQRAQEAARHVARRERLLDVASRGAARARASLDERRDEDGYAALHARRP